VNLSLTRRSVLSLIPGTMVVPALSFFHPAAIGAQTPVASPSPTNSLVGILQDGVKRGIPGLSLYAHIEGQSPIFAVAGVGSLERQTPVTVEDRFRIYSITKTFTAIVTLQLVDEGLLTLDDLVTDWLTDPVVLSIPHIDQITLRQLLTHTSGIYDYFDDNSPFFQDAFFGPTADWSKVWTPLELLAYADGTHQAPYAAPGVASHYSNTNYILLGLIVERATGNRYVDELQRRILDPLDLDETMLASDEPAAGATVDGYHLIDGSLVNVSETNTSWAWTAGGMVSTTSDMARFAAAAFGGTLLSPAMAAEMFDFDTSNSDFGFGMGLGQGRTPFGQAIAMDGESAGFSSVMLTIPEAGLTMVLLSNMAPGGELFETIGNDLIEAALQLA
jgi:D-alanyl-D-alanine carboxypeptidase